MIARAQHSTGDHRKKLRTGAYNQGLFQGTTNAIKDPASPYYTGELIDAWARGWEDAQQARVAWGFDRQPALDIERLYARSAARGQRLWGKDYRVKVRLPLERPE